MAAIEDNDYKEEKIGCTQRLAERDCDVLALITRANHH